MVLSDNETKIDLLNNEPIATTIISLLRERRDVPVTVGVHGDWGAGKSSVLEMIEAGLEGDKHVLCLKFNGWRFQGFEDAKIALIEGIVAGLIEKRPVLAKTTAAVKNVLRRIDWLKVARRAGGLALTAYTGVPTPGLVQAALGSFDRFLADPAKLATKENLDAAIEGAKSLLKSDFESKNVPEEIGAFREAFDDLLKAASVERLVVLIDDLDRCLPDTASETLEAVRLFVFTSKTAFVVAADEAMIEYAVRRHFPDLPASAGPRDYARNYLEKLIQVPFRIPPLGEAETRIYVTLLLVGAELGDEDPDYLRLINAAGEHLKRPWQGAALDAAAVKSTLGEAKAPKAQGALTLSDQIGPILAAGTKGNPRQIKRFLNTLLLRQHMAEARGFGDDVKLPALAKLMLAERFLPGLFDQIAGAAASDPGGLCNDLAALEAAAKEAAGAAPAIGAARGQARAVAPSPRAAPKTRGQAEVEGAPIATSVARSTALTEWLSSSTILEWARVSPALGGADLRPYLFVSKERKDYFGAASMPGHLAALVDRLMGPKLSVLTLAPELKSLTPPEAAQLVEAVHERMTANDTFDTEPAGAPGLGVLVRTHPFLQSKLVDLLESLPPSRLGPWVVGGWEGVITDRQASTRLDHLLDSFAAGLETSTMLKTAAAAALRTRRGRS